MKDWLEYVDENNYDAMNYINDFYININKKIEIKDNTLNDIIENYITCKIGKKEIINLIIDY